MGAVEGGDLWLGVRQWISSVLGTEKDTPRCQPFLGIEENRLCRLCMLPLWEGKAIMIEQSST